MTHFPKFLIINTILLAIGVAAWWSGLLDGFAKLAAHEFIIVGALGVYAAIGLVAAARSRVHTARHIAHGVPMWGLTGTGIGLMLAVIALTNLETVTLMACFKAMVLAVAPNVAASAYMNWIREVLHWSAGESI